MLIMDRLRNNISLTDILDQWYNFFIETVEIQRKVFSILRYWRCLFLLKKKENVYEETTDHDHK